MKVTIYPQNADQPRHLFEEVDEIALLDAESHGPKPAEFVGEDSQKLLLVYPANTTAIKVER